MSPIFIATSFQYSIETPFGHRKLSQIISKVPLSLAFFSLLFLFPSGWVPSRSTIHPTNSVLNYTFSYFHSSRRRYVPLLQSPHIASGPSGVAGGVAMLDNTCWTGRYSPTITNSYWWPVYAWESRPNA
jgi:hypothetical protein